MTYEQFRAAFLGALKESGLPTIGAVPSKEILDLRSTDRVVTVYVEPLGREADGPFHVSGEVSWRWGALQTARAASTEEDLLTELFGRDKLQDVETDRPCLRIDISLRASLELGKPIPMPPPATWSQWCREAMGRLENVERLVSREVTRETSDGRHAILAWQGAPAIKATCNPSGELRLEAITVSAFQLLDLPRIWDDPDREPDEDPGQQLAMMFRRVKAALYAWGEVTDHLTRS